VPHGNVPRTAQTLLVDHRLLREIEAGVHVRDTIQQDAGLAGVSRVARQDVRFAQRMMPAQHRLLPLAVDQVRADEPPPLAVLDEALAVVHAEPVQRVVRVGVRGVEQQRAVGRGGVEDAARIEPER
jgi:hypothetical protein